MRVAFLILVLLHALIQLLGFVKGFGLKEVKELTLPITKPLGLWWLLAAMLLATYAVLQYANYRFAWLFGLLAVIISQVLIVLFWKDAKFGTIPNLIIFIVSIMAYGQFSFQKMTHAETQQLLSQVQPSAQKPISEKNIEKLPGPVQKWLRVSGVLNKPAINVAKITQEAQMKMKPEQQRWMAASAIQYSTTQEPAFIWTVDAKMNTFLFFCGRDKFTNGKGEMLIKLNALFNMVNQQGEKLDEGSLQRFLGEMVWLPSLALSSHITWESINDTVAKATLTYKGTNGSGYFYFNADGDFTKFSTMRFMGNKERSKRHEWVLLVDGYGVFEGIKIPTDMTATWKLENGDWTWLKLKVTDVKYNGNALP